MQANGIQLSTTNKKQPNYTKKDKGCLLIIFGSASIYETHWRSIRLILGFVLYDSEQFNSWL